MLRFCVKNQKDFDFDKYYLSEAQSFGLEADCRKLMCESVEQERLIKNLTGVLEMQLPFPVNLTNKL